MRQAREDRAVRSGSGGLSVRWQSSGFNTDFVAGRGPQHWTRAQWLDPTPAASDPGFSRAAVNASSLLNSAPGLGSSG